MQGPLPITSTSLANISRPHPPMNPPPSLEDNSLPPPNFNFISNSHINLSSRHSQLPKLRSPPYLYS